LNPACSSLKELTNPSFRSVERYESDPRCRYLQEAGKRRHMVQCRGVLKICDIVL
jgi:hypothetical protein